MGTEYWLEELREWLKRAKEADQDLQQFGAEVHQYKWKEKASLEEVEAFERKIQAKLPEEYRKFLLQAGNGGAGPYYGLFSLKEVYGWMNEGDYKQGQLPIASQGDGYFVCLQVTGADRGRLSYQGEDYLFFPRESGFLAWYLRWLREVASGYEIFWFGTNLDGDEEELCRQYREAATVKERWLILESMQKFPTLSKETAALIEEAAEEYSDTSDADLLLRLLGRIDIQKKDALLQRRWEAGLYDAGVAEVYHSLRDLKEEEKAAVLAYWGEQILLAVPKLADSSWYLAFQILIKCPQIHLKDVIGFWKIASQKNKPELIRAFGQFEDAKDDLDLFLELLEEREDVALLNAAVMAVPIAPSERLVEKLERICNEMESSIYVTQREEDIEEARRKSDQSRVFFNACHVKELVEERMINPPMPGIPRPHILRIIPHQPWEKRKGSEHRDLAIHPLIALVLQKIYGRLPSTRADWDLLFPEIKKLHLVLDPDYLDSGLERHTVYLKKPDEYGFPERTYAYDTDDWSAIGRMSNLRELVIEQICVNDFSFLTQCKKMKRLSLYNTNFSDCRLLLQMPGLQQADLRSCPLMHTEVLTGFQVIL